MELWKSVQAVSRLLLKAFCLVHGVDGHVDFAGPPGDPKRFTSFLIMNVLGKSLSSTETIVKLVEKPVQISVGLPQLRYLIDRV